MKINFNHPHLDAVKTGQKPKTPSSDAGFKNLLKDTLSQQPDAKESVTSAPQPMAIGKPDLRVESHLTFHRAVDRIDRFLDVLESYRTGLADPNVSLKDLYPLVCRIDADKDHLAAMKTELDGDERLTGILDEVLVYANLEVAKFNRGDYL